MLCDRYPVMVCFASLCYTHRISMDLVAHVEPYRSYFVPEPSNTFRFHVATSIDPGPYWKLKLTGAISETTSDLLLKLTWDITWKNIWIFLLAHVFLYLFSCVIGFFVCLCGSWCVICIFAYALDFHIKWLFIKYIYAKLLYDVKIMERENM